MSDEKQIKHYTVDELVKLNAMQGKILSDIIYHKWINKTDPQSLYIFIDKLELRFGDNTNVVLSGGEESDGLRILENYNPTEDILETEKMFEGKITIRSERASGNEFFAGVVGSEITAVCLSKDGGEYLADAIVLEFDQEKRLIALSPEEGIIVDYFED